MRFQLAKFWTYGVPRRLGAPVRCASQAGLVRLHGRRKCPNWDKAISQTLCGTRGCQVRSMLRPSNAPCGLLNAFMGHFEAGPCLRQC